MKNHPKIFVFGVIQVKPPQVFVVFGGSTGIELLKTYCFIVFKVVQGATS